MDLVPEEFVASKGPPVPVGLVTLERALELGAAFY